MLTIPLPGSAFTLAGAAAEVAVSLSKATGNDGVSVGQNHSGLNTAFTLGPAFTFPQLMGSLIAVTTFMVDGLNDQNAWYNTYAVAPIVDAMQKFKVGSHNSEAQFGSVTGGVINVVTKSGTNELHGTAWEYLRNDFFGRTGHVSIHCNALKQNQFGGLLGGQYGFPRFTTE